MVTESLYFSKDTFMLYFFPTDMTCFVLSPALDFSLAAQFCQVTKRTSAMQALIDKQVRSTDFSCTIFIKTTF